MGDYYLRLFFEVAYYCNKSKANATESAMCRDLGAKILKTGRMCNEAEKLHATTDLVLYGTGVGYTLNSFVYKITNHVTFPPPTSFTTWFPMMFYSLWFILFHKEWHHDALNASRPRVILNGNGFW